MRNKTKLRSLFTKKVTNTNIPTPETPQDSPSSSTYRSITELPLSRWVDYVADGYLHALAKTGTPPEAELRAAADELRIQVADVAGDHEYKLYCNTVKEITNLELTIVQVQELVNVLKDVYVEVFAAQLNRLLPNSNLVFDVSKPEQYDRTLQRALNRSKGLKLSVDLKKQKLEALQIKYGAQGTGKVNREYFMGVLLTLSDAARYPLSDSITVWEFYERMKRHNRAAEAMIAAAAKK